MASIRGRVGTLGPWNTDAPQSVPGAGAGAGAGGGVVTAAESYGGAASRNLP